MFNFRPLSVALACACVLATPGAHAAKYAVVDQGVEVGADANISGFKVGLNASGVVSVTAQGRALMIDHGVVTDVGTFGGSKSYMRALNDAGVAVGYSYTASGASYGFWSSNGVLTDVGVLPGFTASTLDAVNGIGHGVGTIWSISTGTHAVLFAQGQLHDVGVPAFGQVIVADGINAADDFTGVAMVGQERHAFVYRGSKFKDLGTLSHAANAPNESWGEAINDKGVVVGYTSTKDGWDYHAMGYWGGAMHDLGTLGGATPAWSFAHGIDSRGTIVGQSTYSYADGEPYSAFVFFKNQARMSDLNKLLVAKSRDWHLICAYAINEAGQIAGIGTRDGVGGVRVFVATPQ